MATKKWTLTDIDKDIHEPEFSVSAKDVGGAAKGFSVRKRTLHGGLREGVETVEVDNGVFRFVVLPTRGMGLWKAWLGELELGWKSPVRGPVHPQFVPLGEGSGLGWLDGFDEFMCRCGLESNGAPDFDAEGALKYPLHGKIANRPAHKLDLSIDGDSGEIVLTGIVDETRFHFQKLRLVSKIITKAGQPGLRIIDEVANLSGNPAEMQMLYHVNFGHPLLDPGAKVVAPVKTLTPKDARAEEGIKTWDSYANEQAGFSEQVYFLKLAAGSDGQSHVLIKNAHGMQGASLRFPVKQLPCFTIWKNTPMAADGYVTGLEPATNFPNPRTAETAEGRVVKLGPGEKVQFELALDVHGNSESVAKAEQAVAKLQGSVAPKIQSPPKKNTA